MPMRWTPENDQTLLLKIIEVSNLSVDVRAIADRWPTKDGEEGPTPRAITERLHKIRAQVKASGGNMSVTGKGKAAAGKDPLKPKATGVSTPRKPKATKKETPPTPESTTPIKQENDLGRFAAMSNADDGGVKSESDGSSSQHEPLTPVSSKRKSSFDVGLNAGDSTQYLGNFPAKRQHMASPAPAFRGNVSSMPMTMPMQNFSTNVNSHGFQFMDQTEA